MNQKTQERWEGQRPPWSGEEAAGPLGIGGGEGAVCQVRMWGSPCPLNPQEPEGDLKGAGPETAGGARAHPTMWTPRNYNSQQHLNITAPNRPWHREAVTADTRLSPRVGEVELHQCAQSSWMWLETSCCGPGPLKAMGAEQPPPFQALLKALLWEGLQPPSPLPALKHYSCLFCSFGTYCLVTSCTAPLRGSMM